ncbi:MAG: PAS domain S-box protein, partial [Alphaproteobacteria bacterium]
IAIAIADRDGTIQYVNQQYTEMTGNTPTETIGTELTALFVDNDGQISSQIFQALADEGSW